MAEWLHRRKTAGRPFETLGDPWALELREALRARRFDVLEEFFQRCDARWKSFYLKAVSAWSGRPRFLEVWPEREPGSALPFLVRGAHGIHWAWAARGRGEARRVSERARRRFFARIRSAQDDLYQAAELAPRSHLPWAFLVAVGCSSWSELDEIRAVFEKAHAREPWDWYGARQMLEATTEKWHGSHAEMFAFAREIAGGARPASGLHALVALAHVERALAAEEPGEERGAWLRRPEVRNELASAWVHSLGSPGIRASRYTIPQCNAFALALAGAGEDVLAGEALRRTHGLATDDPWSLVASPRRAYARACQQLGVSFA